jgi:NAD(P)-dependent dehydrogenase (short-subunit alcohol dehydrogenase family)
MADKIWFITGSSRGFGRVWAEAALERGDKVAATARKLEDLKDLSERFPNAVLPLQLDVTNRESVFTQVRAARQHFGRIDVMVNNAGYGQFGAIEEISEAEARAQMETNYFGALWVLQAVLPIMREQKGGHILSVSSIGGIVAFPNIGMYHASKWALEAVNDSMAQEVASFGIKVTLIEPGGFSTDWGGRSAKHAQQIPAYDGLREKAAERRKNMVAGDPQATAQAIFKVVDSNEPPLRLFLGTSPLPTAKEKYQERLATWEAWSEVSREAQGTAAASPG